MPALLSAWELLCQQFRVLPPTSSPQWVLLSAGSVSPCRTGLPFPFPPFCPSSLPPAQQQPKMLQCLQRERVRMTWGPRSAVGSGFWHCTCWSDIVSESFPWLSWEHLRDCNHCTGLPWGHMERVLHRLLMRCRGVGAVHGIIDGWAEKRYAYGRACRWKPPICLNYQERNLWLACASLYLERLCHAFSTP